MTISFMRCGGSYRRLFRAYSRFIDLFSSSGLLLRLVASAIAATLHGACTLPGAAQDSFSSSGSFFGTDDYYIDYVPIPIPPPAEQLERALSPKQQARLPRFDTAKPGTRVDPFSAFALPKSSIATDLDNDTGNK